MQAQECDRAGHRSRAEWHSSLQWVSVSHSTMFRLAQNKGEEKTEREEDREGNSDQEQLISQQLQETPQGNLSHQHSELVCDTA